MKPVHTTALGAKTEVLQISLLKKHNYLGMWTYGHPSRCCQSLGTSRFLVQNTSAMAGACHCFSKPGATDSPTAESKG
jgi:hypothetical protein